MRAIAATKYSNNAALNCMPLVSEVITTEGGIWVEVVLLGGILVVEEVVPVDAVEEVNFGPREVGEPESPGDEVDEIDTESGEVGDVPGVTVGEAIVEVGTAKELLTDNEVMLSADVNEDTNEDWSEIKLPRELKTLASAEGLNGTSVIGEPSSLVAP